MSYIEARYNTVSGYIWLFCSQSYCLSDSWYVDSYSWCFVASKIMCSSLEFWDGAVLGLGVGVSSSSVESSASAAWVGRGAIGANCLFIRHNTFIRLEHVHFSTMDSVTLLYSGHSNPKRLPRTWCLHCRDSLN